MKSNVKNPITRTFTGFAICCATVFIFNLSPSIAAPNDTSNPETLAAVKKLLVTMKVKESMEPALKGMKQMQSSMIDQQKLTDEQKAAAKEIMAASMTEVEKMMSWDSIGTLISRVYAKVFTTEEVNELITLFESPAGQTYVNKQGALQTATIQEMQKLMVTIMPKIQAQTKAAIERVAKESQNK